MSTVKEAVKNNLPAPLYNVLREGRDALVRASMSRMTDGTLQDRLDNLARKTVNGRVGKPDEIAQAIYFLADSTQSSFITGQALIVDGGATARLSTE